MGAALREYDMTVPQYSCLEQLAHQPGLTNTELARGTFVSRQAMHQLLATLKASTSSTATAAVAVSISPSRTTAPGASMTPPRLSPPSKNACSPRATPINDDASTLTSPPAPTHSTDEDEGYPLLKSVMNMNLRSGAG